MTIRAENAAESLKVVKQISLALLEQEKTNKISITESQEKARIDNEYLLKILNAQISVKALQG